MNNLLSAILLSIVQGISEWLPISSSGHLVLFHKIFGLESLQFDVFLHFSSILAIIIVFRKDIMEVFNLRKKGSFKFLGLLVIASIPAALIGVLFKDFIEKAFSNILFLGIFFMISGIIIYFTKFSKIRKDNLSWYDSLFIGLFEAVAVFPGISRSGATISAGMYRGLKKESVIKFSFLLAIIIILGASILELPNLDFGEFNYMLLIVSFFVSLIVSLFTIKFLLKIIKGNLFWFFGIYNFLLGLFLLIWSILIRSIF